MLRMRSPSHLSRALPRTGTTTVGSVTADESPWTARKHDETWSDPEMLSFIYGLILFHYFLERPAVSLKSAPAQLPAADAAVLGLFSVKQTGLLAFKPALHPSTTPERKSRPILARLHLPFFFIIQTNYYKGKKKRRTLTNHRAHQVILGPHRG